MDYPTAYDKARNMADSLKRDVGIEKRFEFGKVVYNTFLLPNPENRRGHELTCEVVSPKILD